MIEPKSILPEPEWFQAEMDRTKVIKYKVWTVKEEKELILMFSDGCSAKVAAKRLNRSVYSVFRKSRRLSII